MEGDIASHQPRLPMTSSEFGEAGPVQQISNGTAVDSQLSQGRAPRGAVLDTKAMPPRKRRGRAAGYAACEACSDLKIRCERDPTNIYAPCKRCAKTNRSCVATVKKSTMGPRLKANDVDIEGVIEPRRKKQKKLQLENGERLPSIQPPMSSQSQPHQEHLSSSKILPLSIPFPSTSQASLSIQRAAPDQQSGINEAAKYHWISKIDWMKNRDARGPSVYVSPYPAQPALQVDHGLRYQYPDPDSITGDGQRVNFPTRAKNLTNWTSSSLAIRDLLISPVNENEQNEDDAGAESEDSDYGNLQSEIARIEEMFTKESSDEETQAGETGRRGRGRPRRRIGVTPGGHKGPRKAAEPTGDIKIRLSKASLAFMEGNYEDAIKLLEDVVRINAETYEAWSLLATIFKEIGQFGRSMSCLIYACHLRPKDVQGWLNCAQVALDESGDMRPLYLTVAQLCYAGAIRANPRNCHDARMGKAAILREQDKSATAISEYRKILDERPHDTTVLRHIAECFIDRGDVTKARELYQHSIAYYQATSDSAAQVFGWSDVNIYVELYGFFGQYQDAIKELRALSRWLLGRKNEIYWDSMEDDREWDDDNVRRLEVVDFSANNFDENFYGHGLPLELRVKLGIYRSRLGQNEESLAHLSWLDPSNLSQENRVLDYPDLFLDAANCLREAGLYRDALVYYRALRSLPETEASLYLEMGRCYVEASLHIEAEECFQMAIQIDESNIEARMQLATLYQTINEDEQALICITEAINIKNSENEQAGKSNETPLHEQIGNTGDKFMPVPLRKQSYYVPRRRQDPAELERQNKLMAEHVQEQYTKLVLQQEDMRAGQHEATVAWMSAARNLTEDFRSSKQLYPWHKYAKYVGFVTPAPRKSGIPIDNDMVEMANQISDRLGAAINANGNSNVHMQLPDNYRGISFSDWLDLFLEYALCLAKSGEPRRAYEVCEAAKDAVVFYRDRESMFLIHVCWCTCALLANDEPSCVSTCEFFTTKYQFTTDSYRMFAALTKLSQSPISWYKSGPTQREMLNQIKAMDYGLADKGSQEKLDKDRAKYSAQDDAGHLIINKDMDVALLMLYGHILYSGSSYAYALNYFFRAYALDPENPMINLSIGLGYIHWALKRQSENRQFHILQGLFFLFRYYDCRRVSTDVGERQEAHYNIARTYHTLGLTSLALPYYMRALEETDNNEQDAGYDLTTDAAFNLQSIYATSGNFVMAKMITDKWLVI